VEVGWALGADAVATRSSSTSAFKARQQKLIARTARQITRGVPYGARSGREEQ